MYLSNIVSLVNLVALQAETEGSDFVGNVKWVLISAVPFLIMAVIIYVIFKLIKK